MTRHLALCRALPARPITAALLALTLTLGQPPGARADAEHLRCAGVVAVSHPLAAAAAADVLARGGNAVDAAAAAQFALNVVEPQSSGIGGGFFALVHLAGDGAIHVVDARERAPAAAGADLFAPAGQVLPFALASTSGVAVGVPGTMRGIATMLERWGTRSLADTLEPAIALAERGFRVNRFLAADIANDHGRTQVHAETAAVFRPDGKPLAEGDWLVQPDLARTLRLLAREGADAFYRGPLAEAIIAAQRRTRDELGDAGVGRMRLHDLAEYRVTLRQPLIGRYRGWTVATMPPPSSGGVALLQMLALLEPLPIGDVTAGYGLNQPATLHAMIEAMRLAFADRARWLGDTDFWPVPTEGLLDAGYLAARAALIEPQRRMPLAAPGTPPGAHTALPGAAAESPHTTHFTIADRWGNVVSLTTTIEATWGSGITVPGYGFLLNNELTDFDFAPTPGANAVAPGKRPRSSMTPTLLLRDGRVHAALGSPGGPTIINSVLNVLLNLLDHGLPPEQAIHPPRLSVTHADGQVRCEGGEAFMRPAIGVASQDALRALGHVGLGDPGTDACVARIGSVQVIVRDASSGAWVGAADPRREGTVIRVPATAGQNRLSCPPATGGRNRSHASGGSS